MSTAWAPAIEERDIDFVARHAAPHRLLEAIPDVLQRWLLPVDWSQHRLWEIDRPVDCVAVAALRWHYPLPWWRAEDDRWFQVTPAEFMAAPHRFPHHRERVEAADLAYPLRAIHRHGRTVVLDGIDRLVRADLLGLEAVDVVHLALEDLWFISRPSGEEATGRRMVIGTATGATPSPVFPGGGHP